MANALTQPHAPTDTDINCCRLLLMTIFYLLWDIIFLFFFTVIVLVVFDVGFPTKLFVSVRECRVKTPQSLSTHTQRIS